MGFRAWIAGAVSVDYSRTLALPHNYASRGDLPGTESTVIPVRNLDFLAKVNKKDCVSVLLTFVGAKASNAYIENLLRSGLCNLFSCVMVVTKKTGWRGKRHVDSISYWPSRSSRKLM